MRSKEHEEGVLATMQVSMGVHIFVQQNGICVEESTEINSVYFQRSTQM